MGRRLIWVGVVAPIVAEQRPVGHHHLNLHRHPRGGLLAGQPGDHQVGHQLPTATRVALLFEPVGIPGQRCVGCDALGDRQEPGQQRHRVRCRPQAHPTVRDRSAAAAQDRTGIQLVGQPAGFALHPAVAEMLEPRCEPEIDHSPVLDAQDGGLADHQGGPPLADLTTGQRGQGVWHLGHQRRGQPEMAGAAVRAVPAGQRDLGGHPPTLLSRIHLNLRPREVDGDPGLGRGRRTLQLLQQPELVDPLSVPNPRVQHRQPGDPAAQLRGPQHRPPLRLIPDLHALIRPDSTDTPAPKPRPHPTLWTTIRTKILEASATAKHCCPARAFRVRPGHLALIVGSTPPKPWPAVYCGDAIRRRP